MNIYSRDGHWTGRKLSEYRLPSTQVIARMLDNLLENVDTIIDAIKADSDADEVPG